MELSVRYMERPDNKLPFKQYKKQLNAEFDKFVGIIRSSGFRLNSWHRGRRRFYVPALDVYVYHPNPHNGWGTITINNATKAKLEEVQSWLTSHFEYLLYNVSDYYTPKELKKLITIYDVVKLHKVEFAYDFCFQGGTLAVYAALVLRLGRSIVPINAVNTFAIAIVGNHKKCRDKAVNGPITVYVQSCTRADRFISSELLNRNTKAATHTKIYLKLQNGVWTLRIEMTPSPQKLKTLLKKKQYRFDPCNMAELFDVCRIPFSDLYEFKESDPERFADFIPDPSISLGDRIRYHFKAPSPDDLDGPIRDYAFRAELLKSSKMPVAEQLRAMSNACSAYKIHQMRKARLIDRISFDQAANIPLPYDFYIAQRKGRKPLPEDVLIVEGPDVVLRPFHKQPEPPKKPERREPAKSRLVQTSLFPAPIPRADGPLPHDFVKGGNCIGLPFPCSTRAPTRDFECSDTIYREQLARSRLRASLKKESFIKVALRRRLAARCPPRE